MQRKPSSEAMSSKQSKRTQLGTVMTSQPSLPTLPEVDFWYMDADVKGGEGYDLITHFLHPIGKPNGLFLSSATINVFGEALLTAAEKGVNHCDIVVALFYLVDIGDTWELTKVVQKAFEGASTPNVTNLDAGGLKVALWMQKESSKKTFLYKSTSGAMRSIKERSNAFMAPLISCWPPPITLYGQKQYASVLVILKDTNREQALLVMLESAPPTGRAYRVLLCKGVLSLFYLLWVLMG
jgi:hypothetical protein